MPAGQWANTVVDFSSEYSPNYWAAHQALGEPNTMSYGDIVTAWAPLPMNAGGAHDRFEHLTVRFANPVNATGVMIRETYGNGFVYQVDFLFIDTNSTQTVHTWTDVDPSQPGSPVDFTISIPATTTPVNAVKIYVDIDHDVNAWEEIDAVQLLDGVNTPPVTNGNLAITASDVTMTYADGTTLNGISGYTSSGLQSGDTIDSVTLTTDATVSGSGNWNVGSWTIFASAATGTAFNAANYSISYVVGTLTVNAAALTVTADNQSKTYGTTSTFAGTEFTTSGLVNSDTVTSVSLTSSGAAATATVAGSPYPIVPSNATGDGLANYNISYVNGALTVNPAPLTVTAANASKAWGDNDPASFSATYTGLVNGDCAATFTGEIARVAGEDPGIYAINQGTLVATGNYTIGTFVPGVFTIIPWGWVGGRVWVDANGNGIQDTGEPPQPNATVELLRLGTGVVSTTTTGATGGYGFVNLDQTQDYAIRVTLSDGFTNTFFQAGNNPAVDSDLGSADLQSNYFTVGIGQSKTVDGGLIAFWVDTTDTVVGAAAVPGNSQYTYTFVHPGTLDGLTWGLRGVDGAAPPGDVMNSVVERVGNYNPTSGVAVGTVLLQFGNSVAANVFLDAKINGVTIASKEIYVVQVTVAFGDYLSYSGDSGPTDVPAAEGLTAPNGIALKGVLSAFPNNGANWAANVTLTGPGNNLGVDQIRVGFIQHITIQSRSGQYANGAPGAPTRLVSSLQGQTFLDMAPDDGGGYGVDPWYSREPGAVLNGTRGMIQADDTPGMSVPLLLSINPDGGININQMTWPVVNAAANLALTDPNYLTNPNYINNLRRLNQINLLAQFVLDVAASTADTTNGANNSYWAQYRANWAFNGSGTVAPFNPNTNNVLWEGVGAYTNGDASWAALAAPTPENISGPIFNQANAISTFTVAP